MKGLADQYALLPHTQDFQTPFETSVLDELKKSLPQNLSGQEFFIKDDSSYRFALTFLLLLDRGGVPIPLSNHYNDELLTEVQKTFPKAGLIKNGEVSESASGSSSFQGYVCLTSGTTGSSKPCYLSLEGAKLNARMHAEGFEIHSEQAIIQSLPVTHSYGIIAYIWTPLMTGCSVDFMKSFVGLRPLRTVVDRTKKVLHMSPSQMRFILKDKESPSLVPGTLTIGAGAISKEEVHLLLQTFPESKIFSSYGATELGPRVTAGRISENIIADSYIGEALSGVELRVLDDAGSAHVEGRGYLMVRTPSLKKNIQEGELTGDFYLTRDLVEIKNREVYFLSRKDDIIKKSGVTIYPTDIEDLVRRIDGVHDSLALKTPHPLYDEVPILFVESDREKEDLETTIKEKLPPFFWPGELIVKKAFPRTALNKVDREKLKSEMRKP